MKTLTIPATTGNLPAVLDFINTQLEAAGCDRRTQFQINLALEEIYINIAYYAYAPGSGTVTIVTDVTGEPPRLEIQFVDQGRPFNPLAGEEPDTTLTAKEREPGGLGILLTRKSMDDVQYRYADGQNILTLRKTLAGTKPQA